MSPILSIEAGQTNFALKFKESDTLAGLKSRIAKKLSLSEEQLQGTVIKYEWISVYYVLDDDEDWETFQSRAASKDGEIRMLVTGQHIPQPVFSPPHGTRRLDLNDSTNDTQSVYSSFSGKSNSYHGGKYAMPGKAHSVHLIASSERDGSTASKPRSIAAESDAGSVRTATIHMSRKGYAKSTVGTIHSDFSLMSKAFDDFQHSRGVRTFIGSIGPIENVRMMMKAGHRACYMSREFAQQHNFIPKDAAPGFYGFSGITSLGTWPIKVGEKTVQQQVMLVENAFFPVVLGRSFMEKRGVRTDPLDQTSVHFMDTGEIIPTDVVVVKDSNGVPVPIP